jgi:hypothetical protein
MPTGDRDAVLDGWLEEPFDGDVDAERDALWHEPYAPLDLDGGRMYARRREGLPIRLDARCAACGIDRPVCGSRTCIRRPE